MHIEELKSEIVKLEASINGSKIEQEKIPLVQEEIKDKYMQLRNKTTNLLENADSEKLNNPDFLESINVNKINGVYVHKECIEGWTVVVTMDDIAKMEEKNGLSSLEFKGCEIKCAMFNKKFEDCTFENCNLLSCTLGNTEFVNTTFKAVTFYDNVLQNVKFENCKFVNCDNVEMIPFTNPHTEKSSNIEFINTEIKNSQVNLNRADTTLDLKSVRFKNCSIENLECCIDKINYQNQFISKKVSSEKTLMKLLGRDLKKSLKLGENTTSKKKNRRVKVH
ncbi:MAG: pentapeptide repeat-containing protein [Lachnospiraceae bacterium]|nr:pentapeptide repeat-containing protein [Lachnospiraceae bacterium]